MYIKTNVSAEVEAVFQVTVPPLGYAIYTTRPSNKQGQQTSVHYNRIKLDDHNINVINYLLI